MNGWHLIMSGIEMYSLTINNIHVVHSFFFLHVSTKTCSNQPRSVADPGLWSVSQACCESKNEEECWVCLDYGRLYEFQKIDFPSPVWLDIKARQNFIESVPTWLDFWTLELWPVDSIMNAFVFSYLLHGFTFTNWPIDSAIIVFSPDLFPYSCVFYNCEELWVHCWEMVQWHSQ